MEYDLTGFWTTETLKARLEDRFEGAIDEHSEVPGRSQYEIDKREAFVMSPELEMNEEDFKKTFTEFCKKNNRKGHFEENVYATSSFVFEE